MTARFFRRKWEQPRSDQWASWGPSWWFFETDAAGMVQRQIQVYEEGPILRYDTQHTSDEHGGLAAGQCLWKTEDWSEFEIDRQLFETVWSA